MSFRTKTVITISIVFVFIVIGLISVINFMSLAFSNIIFNEKDISQIEIVNHDKAIKITDKDDKDNLYRILKDIRLNEKIVSEQVPTGWTYNVYFYNSNKDLLLELIFVGESILYKNDWYKIDKAVILELHNYHNTNKN